MGWIAFAALLIVFVTTMVWVRARMGTRMAELEGAHRRHVAKLTNEADARTARVERASMAEAERMGVALAEDLLPVADALKAAVEIEEGASVQDVRAGVELARRELGRAFVAHGIEPIDPELGEPFDPVRHEAVEKIGDGDEVVRVHRIGWVHGDRVLRSALVGVGRTEPEKPEVEKSEDEDEVATAEQSAVERAGK